MMKLTFAILMLVATAIAIASHERPATFSERWEALGNPTQQEK